MALGRVMQLPGRHGRPGETGLAWDVYLLYKREARWRDGPPAPGFWMHQMMGIDPGLAPFFDGEVFRKRVRELLGDDAGDAVGDDHEAGPVER